MVMKKMLDVQPSKGTERGLFPGGERILKGQRSIFFLDYLCSFLVTNGVPEYKVIDVPEKGDPYNLTNGSDCDPKVLSFITHNMRILFHKAPLYESIRFIFTCEKSLYSQSEWLTALSRVEV